jgi:hypothetical protein
MEEARTELFAGAMAERMTQLRHWRWQKWVILGCGVVIAFAAGIVTSLRGY